ncbi:N-acetylmuramoyl-L-alanine amidase [Nocardia vaccinii]|uniref:N-acetylmuramoyl-L-alanine amidase n=1 Tax=Nocardia vaccinii TaxID=1822 RepID=UPI00082A41F1|nr:N-acetylmuramoyl-L-alanine amidase [Nocardia vaccinii]
MNRRRSGATALSACAALLTACGSGSASTSPQRPSLTPTPVTSTYTAPAAIGAGRVIVLDPGHNGGNAGHSAAINRRVPDGRGGMKACNTTGTAALGGYPEHAFNWDVATRVRDALSAKGFTVVMTRPDDSGVGPCVDERAAIGNRADAAAVVSIHADGSPGANSHGFHVAYSAPPRNPAQGEPSIRLATTLRDSFTAAGFSPSTYVGSHGLDPRGDLSGLNLSERPTALVECGNMHHPGDAAVLESRDGRARIATVIANAIITYVG